MKVIRIEKDGKLQTAHIYPFLQPDQELPPDPGTKFTVTRDAAHERVLVNLDFSGWRSFTAGEILTVIDALKLAAKLAQVYTDVP